MGLAEKRMAAAYQSDSFPMWQQKINKIVGAELTWIVNFNDLVKEGFIDSYPKTLDYNYFLPLEKVLTSICADKLGQEAFQAKIKKILITSTRSWSSMDATVEGDTLHLDSDPIYNRDESTVETHAELFNKVLEKNL